MDNKEKQIREQVSKRVFDEIDRIEQMKMDDANRQALSEITSVPRSDVDQIAKDIRNDIERKQQLYKTVITYAIVSLVAFIFLCIVMMIFKYNKMVSFSENVQKNWGQVENVYQRRLDLIPNLVETVKAYAQHERETFELIAQARSKAGGVLNLSENVLDHPESLEKFLKAQTELSNRLHQLMVVVERYPDLKADQHFLALQSQIEGSENRIAVERKRLNEAVHNYNAYIKRFPQVMFAGMFGYKEKGYFKSEQGSEKPPKVQFN